MPLAIAPGVEIPDEELIVTASRSGGPGGQHVNKTASRVMVRFVIAESPSLSPEDRATLLTRLGRRIAADGSVRVVSQDSRSQHANRRTALARLAALLSGALTPEIPRVATRVPRSSRTARREGKRRRGDVKRGRGRVRTEDA
ncbi:MAG TPA: alternative ribosome rescue aminoacyl-tRNA hydrolase ArfB [Candidatus Polarisedimenticolaceae bacterium]|nr:alternative ribosome rescue aminoacyl-tRNA hydrolase ArfB [Candidatus Polarisedimenticolaceae bacterium]